MQKKVVYMGDTSLPGSASYLAGIMTHHGIAFDYIPSDKSPDEKVLADDVGLYVFSDYPSENFKDGMLEKICEKIERDASVIMLGGWESFHGLGGDYDVTPLAKLLPVNMADKDDRRNWSQFAMVRKKQDHEILSTLPFNCPPGIGGYNEFTVKDNGKIILAGELYEVDSSRGFPQLSLTGEFPLLVVSEEQTRRVCLATDVAPHWVGGFVDWGDKRVKVEMGDDFIEVGCWYMQFFGNLLSWALGGSK